MALTPDEIRNKQFTTTRLKQGYDEGEVDAFLDDVVAPEIERLLEELAALHSRPEPVAPAPTPPVVVAEPSPQQPAATEPPRSRAEEATGIIAMAEQLALQATGKARADAEAMITEARSVATRLETEAKDKHRSTMDGLEQQRAALERRVEDLRAYEKEYRTRLKAYLEQQLHELDGRGDAPRPPAPVAPARHAAPEAVTTAKIAPAVDHSLPDEQIGQPVSHLRPTLAAGGPNVPVAGAIPLPHSPFAPAQPAPAAPDSAPSPAVHLQEQATNAGASELDGPPREADDQ